MRKIFYNTRIVDANIDEYGSVVINDGLIESVLLLGKDVSNVCITPGLRSLIDACQVKINAVNKVLMPAFVDLHAHFRYPGQSEKEDLESGIAAAKKGGYSTVVLMPNTKPVISSEEDALSVMNKIKTIGGLRAFQTISITKNFEGKDLSHLENLDSKNIPIITEDGFDVENDEMMREAMKIAAKKGIIVSCHCEDRSYAKKAAEAREKGKFKKAEKLLRKAEDIATKRNLEIALETACRVHIAHCSTKKSLDYVAWAKSQESFPGQISVEVTPHHACLSMNMKGLEKEFVNPPLRREKDRKAVVRALQNGLVDAIATDHAPHTMEDKKNGACGFSGIETAFSLCYTELVKKGLISLSRLSELMSEKPAKILGLETGSLKDPWQVDIILVDLKESFFVNPKEFKSKGKYSPIEGKKLFGKILE